MAKKFLNLILVIRADVQVSSYYTTDRKKPEQTSIQRLQNKDQKSSKQQLTTRAKVIDTELNTHLLLNSTIRHCANSREDTKIVGSHYPGSTSNTD